jgi:hypothetical protein
MPITDRNHQVKSLRNRGFNPLLSQGWFQTIAVLNDHFKWRFQTVTVPTISSGGGLSAIGP